MYNIVYEPDFSRVIPACIIDARASIPTIKNQIGDVIKEYIDGQLALITDNCITYKIESESGVLAGVFVINVDTETKTATLLMKELRPAFRTWRMSLDISLIISNFIANKLWEPDFLFSNN